MKLTPEVVELCRGLNYGIVVTRRTDGTLHSTPVWIDSDGEHVLFDTHTRRAKFRHLRRNPRIAVTTLLHDDPQRVYATVYGHVHEFDFEHARIRLDVLGIRWQDLHGAAAADLGSYPGEWPASDEERVTRQPCTAGPLLLERPKGVKPRRPRPGPSTGASRIRERSYPAFASGNCRMRESGCSSCSCSTRLVAMRAQLRRPA